MKDILFSRYIAKNYMGNSLSDRELRVLKTGDVDALVSTFVKMRNERYIQQLQCILKNFKMYLRDTVVLNRITVSEEYEGKFFGCQMMDGDMDILFGIEGDEEVLLKIASQFADEEFDTFDEDAYDSVCEMINCINGSFATRLSGEDVEVILHPPVFYDDIRINSDKGFYIVNMDIDGISFNAIMAIDECVEIASSEGVI